VGETVDLVEAQHDAGVGALLEQLVGHLDGRGQGAEGEEDAVALESQRAVQVPFSRALGAAELDHTVVVVSSPRLEADGLASALGAVQDGGLAFQLVEQWEQPDGVHVKWTTHHQVVSGQSS
jgi:hypothetical protein